MNLKIVISTGASLEARYAAAELRGYIAGYKGITPEIIHGEIADGDIYIGSGKASMGDGYTVSSRDGRLRICADSAYGFEAALSAVTAAMKKNGGALDGIELSGNGSELRTCGAVKNGQLRYITYNVYGYNNSAHGTTSVLRQPYQLSLLGSYDADILAFQEFSNNNPKKRVVRYRSEEFLSGLKRLGYAEVGGGELLNADGVNFTPLFYKPSSVALIDSGYLLYDGANDVNSKSVTWAVFENDEGKRFIAASTHFMWNDPSLGEGIPNTVRCSNANELVRLFAEIRAKHGALPIIVGGDLNCSYARGDIAPLDILSDSGLKWGQANKNALNSYNGHGAYATWDPEKELFDYPSHSAKGGNASIDHVWYDSLSVELFATVTDRYACFSSDHSPKIVDFSI